MNDREKLYQLEIQNVRLRAQNEELRYLVGKDISIRDGNGPWVHVGRIFEELENCETIDEFRDWINYIMEHYNEAMSV